MVCVKCRFDSRFFTTFKNKLAGKETFQKHGILIFDEIHVRKEMRVNVTTMSYTGHADFGGEVEVPEQLADHGLVFTFRPFGDNYSQPVAVFASHGPTKGTVLAQLIVKAILHLEDDGAYVDAIVCDGAAINRSMWTQFSETGALYGTQNSFTSPACEDRRVFVFSDAPHLMKCMRNRLMKKNVFCVNGTRVFWSHYDKLYVVDTKNECCLRVCPKFSFSHLNPSNTEKIRVKLATQLFSMSVA
ncbi:hypothetical protein HPB48_009062 [Haemaphysalis longicornis]|uniref:Transposable element P transposase n=1 Tax=Haemaphysalis longicornis TaxID=44386 RepID=A0A9J6FZM2_HAELO|nr:hypothetical protein HPB48_009062 [Haemaphysalis longicornis]